MTLVLTFGDLIANFTKSPTQPGLIKITGDKANDEVLGVERGSRLREKITVKKRWMVSGAGDKKYLRKLKRGWSTLVWYDPIGIVLIAY